MPSIDWKQKPDTQSLGPHADYAVNLRTAEEFVTKIQSSLFECMQVYLSGSQATGKNLLIISYQPSIGQRGSTYVCPIDINQDNKRFNYEVDYLFNKMYRKINDNNKKKQTMMDFDDRNAP